MYKLKTALYPAIGLMIFALTGGVRTDWGDNVAVAEKWVTAWNSHKADAVVALYTEDALYEDVTFGLVNHGTAEIRKFAEFLFGVVPDLRLELVNNSLKGEHGTIEWIFSGTDQGIHKTARDFKSVE